MNAVEEANNGVGQHRAQNNLRVTDLRFENVNRPDWITPAGPELYKEHFSANEFVCFTALVSLLVTARKLYQEQRDTQSMLFHGATEVTEEES